MKSVSAGQMKKLDETAIKRYGIPSPILMENAGRGIADLAEKIVGQKSKKILVICGKGNNGGDGFVAARHLANCGYRVQVIMLSRTSDLKNDPKLNFQILKKMRIPVKCITSQSKTSQFKAFVQKSDLIIDGIFGVGLKRPVKGLFYDVISILNASKKQILAIDVPSGLDSDSGEELGIAVRAFATGTLGAAKRGLLLKRGPKCSGKVTVLDISIPRELLQ